ncbi:MAG: HAD-IIIC family phosphatase [Candidatus Binataceae bacterium]
MFELDKYDPRLHQTAAAAPVRTYDFESNVAGMALLLWGEHCVECAAPACYATCDLYQPRSDSRCRRFAFGAYKNPTFKSLRGYGVEISFKKWAKIEAFGNTAILPLRSVLRWERALERGAPLANAIGKMVQRFTDRRNWEQLTYIASGKLGRRMHRRGTDGVQPDAFLLEVYNPGVEEVRLQIIFSVSTDDVAQNGHPAPLIAPVIKTLPLPPGYSRHEFEADNFRQILDRGLPFKITMVPEADNNARLVFLSADLVRFKRSATEAKKTKIKCVVFDLDNTVWKGTLAEGDEVVIRPGLAELLKYFDERGTLLSIASKNDFDTAFARLTEFGIADFFLYPQIDWLPKSQKIKTLARRLNIGLDTFAFVDDNDFELEEVARALPEVACIHTDQLDGLKEDERFQGSVTKESRRRRHYYRDQISREIDEAGFGDDYLRFLRSCAIKLEIASYGDSDSERVAELVQRTNQLNFSGRKYSRHELEQVIANPRLDKYVIRCADKYGSYGTVGFCLAEQSGEALRIIDLMLSCRVQGKFIEQALFAHLIKHHNRAQASAVWVNFQPTARNTPARAVLESLGFRACGAGPDGPQAGVILRQAQGLACDFITVTCGPGAVITAAAAVEG